MEIYNNICMNAISIQNLENYNNGNTSAVSNNPFITDDTHFPCTSYDVDSHTYFDEWGSGIFLNSFPDSEPIFRRNLDVDQSLNILPADLKIENLTWVVGKEDMHPESTTWAGIKNSKNPVLNPVKSEKCQRSLFGKIESLTPKRSVRDKEASSQSEEESEKEESQSFSSNFGHQMTDNIEEFDSYVDYSSLVDQILDRSDQYGKELSCRRDVLSKRILRAFRKYIAKLFTSNKGRSKAGKPFEEVKNELVKEAIDLRLINSTPEGTSEELKEFICWMAIAKVTDKTRRLFNYQNKSIKDMADILSHYSHTKLENNIYVSQFLFNMS